MIIPLALFLIAWAFIQTMVMESWFLNYRPYLGTLLGYPMFETSKRDIDRHMVFIDPLRFNEKKRK